MVKQGNEKKEVNIDKQRQNWAEEEFGDAELGDRRLTKRLIELAQQRGAKPHASIAESCGGWASTQAAYRFYDNPQVSMEQIQASHRKSTVKRMARHAIVLGVQDTTQVDLTHHPHTSGVGYLQDLKHSGFLLHTTLMVTPQREPLGLIQQQVWVRDPADYGKRHQRHARPTSEKESQKWLDSLAALSQVQKEVPQTQIVSVGDSEADLYALFAEAAQLDQLFLIRACRDRLILNAEERHLWQYIEQLPVAGTLEVAIGRQAGRPARVASVSIRFAKVDLKIPSREKGRLTAQHLTAWVILAREETPAAEIPDPIEWRLLTNVPTESYDQACERVHWYSCRWVVEMFHRVLKSGCRLEERQFDDLENIQRFLAVDSVVAWRTLHLTLFSREAPGLSCEALLETHEWQALYCFVHKTTRLPVQTPTLSEVTTWIARLGGFTASSKHLPGSMVIWRGLSRLSDIAQAWLAFRPDP